MKNFQNFPEIFGNFRKVFTTLLAHFTENSAVQRVNHIFIVFKCKMNCKWVTSEVASKSDLKFVKK